MKVWLVIGVGRVTMGRKSYDTVMFSYSLVHFYQFYFSANNSAIKAHFLAVHNSLRIFLGDGL